MSDKYILRVIAEAACERLMQQIDKLKADVEEVTNDNIRLTQENGGLRGERDRLASEVERLRFAGDMLAFALAHGDRMEYGCASDPIEEYLDRKEIKEWNAAKEGKQL